MRHLFSANRLIPAGVLAVLALLGADMTLRVVALRRESRQSTMAAVHAKSDGKAAALALRVSTTHGMIADSLDKDSRRAETLRRLQESAGATYLAAMLPQVDSAIRRWPDDRTRRPLRVALARRAVAGFSEDFAGSVQWAANRWNAAHIPVQLDFRGSDTAGADIIVSWVPSLDSGRTGKADVTWDQRQYIRRAAITLATHAPDGRELTRPEMTALALHELGHALGLAHSDESRDALYPMTRSADLSERDRATARLLYELAPGTLRN
jgi:hypothetical protein